MKSKVVKISIVSSIFILLMILATIFDLSISRAMSSVDIDILVSIGEYGKLPGYLALVFGFVFIYSGVGYKFSKVWFIVLCKVALALCVLLSITLTVDYMFAVGLVISLLVSLPISVVVVVLTERFKESISVLFYFGIMLIGAVVLSAVLIEGIKLIWCRERPYMLLESKDYASFTAWFQPMLFTDSRTSEYLLARGIESTEWWGMDGFMSLPSGHAGMCAVIFSLCYLPKFVEKTAKYKWLFYTISIVVTVFVCFSRIVALMHYMSDVVMAVGITLLSMVAVYHITMCIKKRLFKD